MRRRLTVQLWMASILTISGILLLVAGFAVVPRGEIHESVLIAFGEISTFAGALFGVDYNYRMRWYMRDKQEKNKKADTHETN